jgi:hypothetical protein
MINLKDMPIVTVEQVVAFREEALRQIANVEPVGYIDFNYAGNIHIGTEIIWADPSVVHDGMKLYCSAMPVISSDSTDAACGE